MSKAKLRLVKNSYGPVADEQPDPHSWRRDCLTTEEHSVINAAKALARVRKKQEQPHHLLGPHAIAELERLEQVWIARLVVYVGHLKKAESEGRA